MSVPPFAPTFAPLPFGWTEHIGPGGQKYYHHAATQQSTYIRPGPAVIQQPIVSPAPTKKKEKPVAKTLIPGTDWLRVRTTEGNIFYSNKTTKQSLWTVPPEISEAVVQLEKDENTKLEEARKVAAAAEKRGLEQDEFDEVQRVKADVRELVKRRAEDGASESHATKKIKLVGGGEEEEEEDSDDSDDGDGDEEGEEEDWERGAAEQLAEEARIEQKKREEEAQEQKEREVAADKIRQEKAKTIFNVPDRVDLSLDEGKALFKTLLREKDINPLLPWDIALPLFVNDPRYVLLPSVTIRREVFDEYCRERARENRQKAVKSEVAALDPKGEFDRLLIEEVKSTRTSWTDFRRQWKKDRRFYGWTRDEREREKRFREFLKELGEKKRIAAQKAEADFLFMLKESGKVTENSVWKEIKKQFVLDPRYDAVGSSSLREELFHAFLKGKSSGGEQDNDGDVKMGEPETTHEPTAEEREQIKKGKKERAVREREERVRIERQRLDVDIGKSRAGINKEEGEREFRALLVDAIRDPQMTWDSALAQLNTDPRMLGSTLPLNRRVHLFHDHVSHLRSKQMAALYALFSQHTLSLATPFKMLPVGDIITSFPASKLGLDVRSLEDEFNNWQCARTRDARKSFSEMLTENSFVEFWGRLSKLGGEGVEGGVKADDTNDDAEGEGFGGKVDMKVLARNVDVGEMEKVLKNDKRYVIFDHVPEQREKWLREYLASLAAPKASVHIPPQV